MTGGFYEQLGVDATATHGQLRSAYASASTRLGKRRKATLDAGGDVGPLDILRGQLDEAWTVLSDPLRRRRYDAMLSWVASDREVRGLWEQVAPTLVHPAAAAAVRLVRAVTRLDEIGDLPAGPSSSDEPPTLVPADEDLTSPRLPPVARLAPTPVPAAALPAAVVERPTHPPVSATPLPALRVVDGPSSSVIVLDPGRHRKGPQNDEIVGWIERLGTGGVLLRAVREAREISLQDLADTTRISVKYLEAIEADDFEALPSPTFVRGYVREITRVLRIDEEVVVAGYMRRLGG